MAETDRTQPGETDGRRRRSERSREAIVQALFDVVGAGQLRPPARVVAERAGVDIRTVFRHFADMETLYAEMNERLRREAEPLLSSESPTGTLPERVERLVEERVAFFERIAPYKRSGDLQRRDSPFLQDQHQLLMRELRANLRRWLPELAEAPAALLDALDLATSFEAWDRLRTLQRLGRERAQSAMARLARSLASELTE